jgi:nucleotide-binding universal stress UspA family protein
MLSSARAGVDIGAELLVLHDSSVARGRRAHTPFGEEVDLLIVGSRNSGPVGRLFTGQHSNYLARHARRPLLVFPRRAGTPLEG